MWRGIRIYFLLVLCQCWSANVWTQTSNLPISRLGIQQGLSNNSVRCIHQDSKGFIWFGTYDGLNRYDGYEFKIFRNILNDSTSIPHNYIYAIHEDIQNNIWIGTGQGLVTYNSLKSTFIPFYYQSATTGNRSRISINVTALRSDDKSNLFIGTNGWGLLHKKKDNNFATQILFQNAPGNHAGYNVQTLCVDKQQRAWIFVLDIGLCEYNPATGAMRLVNNSIRSANCMEADDKGNLWIGTNSGVYRYAIAGNTMTAHFSEGANQLTINRVVSLCFDKEGKLWIGTEGGGIDILDIEKQTFIYLLPGEGKKDISSESVFALHRDRENRIWIGTLKGGINILDVQRSRFETIINKPFDKNSLINNFTSSFYVDDNNDLWIGTDGGGISVWNRAKDQFTNYAHQAGNNRSLSNNSISCIRRDSRDNLWIATFGGGINRYDPATRSFIHYKCINPLTGEENVNAWLIYEDREKNLWATTFGNGRLYRFNYETNSFVLFDQELNDLIAFTEDHAGNLWCGNASQLIKIDKVNHQHTRYEMAKPVRAILEDPQHRLWVGTEGGGLVLFDKTRGQIAKRYSDVQGLSNNAALNILADEKGHLWISTFNGLSRFDPVTETFRNFYQSDGLQSNQFSYNAALKLPSGELAFGGINGFNIFRPGDIQPRNHMPPVYFTDMLVNSRPLSQVQAYISKSGTHGVDELKVPFRNAVFSLTFTALEYTSAEKIRYAYYLEGWDKDWNYTNVRTINYNNIREGKYVLRVKATNAEGVWNEKEALLNVVILPPWYRTWWAYTLYAILVLAAVYLYYKYKARQAKLKYEIKLAHINAEKEKEINEKRQSFFTNVAHEFRTPLTLVINPIKDLLKKNDTENKTEKTELNIVYRNARRLLSLVDQLLLFRKAENQTDQLRITSLAFSSFCREVFLCFVQQAKAKNIDYVFECENENIGLYGDREKMEIIFFNLLSNALKYTPEGGRIVFKITETEEQVTAGISDNGYGMTPEASERLFEKFYQVKDKNSPAKPGFGIGLFLVRQSVESHKGEVSFETAPGKGTVFTVTLQKGKEHFAGRSISEESGQDAVILHELAGDEQEATTFNRKEKEGLPSVITEKQSILVIDDNESMRQYVVSMFENDFIVRQADNAEDGLKLAKQFLPDMIISDVVMREMSGIEMCRIIKETPLLNHIPVILLTGSFSPESKLKGVEGGADDYITKPFEKDLLMARVASLLKNRQNLQKYFYDEITHQESSQKISGEYKEFLEQCIAIVEKHLDDDAFTIQTLATEIGMSHSKLYKKIKAISGQSANAFIRFIRLRKAAELFITTNYNVNETAFYVGIKDIKYFREQFNKLFGMNPSEYIDKYRKAFGKKYKLDDSAMR